MKHLVILGSLVTLTAACSHYRDVRPGPKGVHKVVVSSDTRGDAAAGAIDQAENYCDESEKRHVIISEKTEFKGSGSESDYKKNKSLSNAAKYGGMAAGIFGGGHVDDLGGVAYVGGVAGDAYLGDPYETTMKFRCK